MKRRELLTHSAALAGAAAITWPAAARAAENTADMMDLSAEVFAEVPFPGHPLGIAVDGRTVYVGTHHDISGQPGVPSHVYAYTVHGEITADWTIEGQAASGQGIAGMALDHDGRLFIVDQAPARIIVLDPKTGGQELYAEIPDVPLCGGGAPDGGCSAAGTDRPAQPINLCFGASGDLFVGDLTQAAIWRVPPGGGSAEVWYTHPDLDSLFGPNTVRFLNSRTLLFADSAYGLLDGADLPTAKGRLYTLEIGPDGKPGRRKLFWEGTAAGETPDGFAIGQSGNVYIAAAVANLLLILGPDGREISRIPTSQKQDVAFDLPGGVAFLDSQLLVTNQAFLGGPQSHQVVFTINVHERGKRLYRPRIRKP